MNGLDIVLINVISYLGGILSGIYIHHKMAKKYTKQDKEKEKEFDNVDKYNSPILTAQAIPTAPPPMNPSLNSVNKRIIITSE